MVKYKIPEHTKKFVQGGVCAIAALTQMGGRDTHYKEVLGSFGIRSVKDMRDHGVEDWDIDILRETIKEMQGDEARQKRRSK